MNKVLTIHPKNPEMRKIRQVIEILKQGAVIAYPTDTVYALGCDLLNKKAIEQLYQIKGILHDHPLSLVCAEMKDISTYATMENPTYRIIRHLLPGPYTCILPATREVPKTILPKRKEIGIRVPNTPILQVLIQELGNPLVSTTAETSDGSPMQWPEDIAKAYPRLALVIDGGLGGIDPTTVIDFTQEPPVVVRQGAGPVDFL